MPYHIFRDVYGNELLAVVDGKRVAHELGRDHRCPTPGLDHLLLPRPVHFVYFLLKLVVDVRTFFQ